MLDGSSSERDKDRVYGPAHLLDSSSLFLVTRLLVEHWPLYSTAHRYFLLLDYMSSNGPYTRQDIEKMEMTQ